MLCCKCFTKNLMGYLIVMICIDFSKRLLELLWYCFHSYRISIEPLRWGLLYTYHIFIIWHFDDNGVNYLRYSTISSLTANWGIAYGSFDIIFVLIKPLWTRIFVRLPKCKQKFLLHHTHKVKEQGIFYKEMFCPQRTLSFLSFNQPWPAEG